MESSEVNQLERATLLAIRFLDGQELTAAQAALLCGVSIRTAQRDLNAMSRVIAIDRDGSGLWRILPEPSSGRDGYNN